jgi:hypothetical protein
MGLLALDVSKFGIVMSADSQPIEIFDGRIRVVKGPGQIRHKPIIVRRAGGFSGLVGYVGRNEIAGKATRFWLERFSAAHPTEPLADFCHLVAEELTREWKRRRLKSGLILFVSGVESREVRFWFVHNTRGLYDHDWTYMQPGQDFQAINDLDDNYVKKDLAPDQTKEQLLAGRMYFFRNGALRPGALIFDHFNATIQTIYAQRIPGYAPLASLNDLAYFDRQRLEFTKRLFSPKHGIATLDPSPVDGDVHVLGVTRSGAICEYGKHRNQVETI